MEYNSNFKLPLRRTRSQTKGISSTINLNAINNRNKISSIKAEPRLTRSRSKNAIQDYLSSQFVNKTSSKSSLGSDGGYGTASEISNTCSDGVVSPNSSRLSISEESICATDEEVPKNSSAKKLVDSTVTTQQQERRRTRSSKILYLFQNGVQALVPASNASNYPGPFSIHLQKNEIYLRGLGCNLRIHHVSPIVSLEPHGIQFHDTHPAIIIIPVLVEPRDINWLSCLYSDTATNNKPEWQRLPKQYYKYSNGNIVVTANHFSLYTVILQEPFPEVLKKIRCRSGGRIRLPDVPGVEVTFPKGCLQHDIDACLRVLFDNEPSFSISDDIPYTTQPLASPIISLGPHGLDFSQSQSPALITLPIPDYDSIKKRCLNAKLIAYQSSTRDGEPTQWQRINFDIPEPTIIAYRQGLSGIPVPTVTIPVRHFSFFKVVWELLSSSLYEAKMGMSYFYPYISFSMMCQAFMEESGENNRFGLEVICYRSDRKLPENTNYRHRVGASLKPKLVRPGRILVRLRSNMFEPDIEAGEEQNMVKEEPDFRGRDFEKQYACRFKPDSSIDRGTFGKVIVERVASKKDPLFEFNLNKTGFETVSAPSVECERWTVFAMKELAASLHITEGSNWKKFAQYIGFTKNEVNNKMQYSADPFLEMMNLYNNRGGTPEEFIQGLYAVSREININSMNGSSPGRGSNCSRSSRDSAGSGSRGSSSQDSKSSPMKRGFWSFRPWGRALNNDSDSDNEVREQDRIKTGKKRSRPSTDKKSSNDSKRRKFSDESETIRTSSDEDCGQKSEASEKHKNNIRKLSDTDLWRISAGIVRKDWRNLGRTLGIEENALLNIEHSHQSIGFRECAYQMLMEWKGRKPRKCTFGELYTALIREKMISVAKFMVVKIATSGEEQEDSS